MVTVPLAGCVLLEILSTSPSASVSLFNAQMVTGVFSGVVVVSSLATGLVCKSSQFSTTVTSTYIISQAPVSSHPVTSIISDCKKPGNGRYSTQLLAKISKPQSKVVCKF